MCLFDESLKGFLTVFLTVLWMSFLDFSLNLSEPLISCEAAVGPVSIQLGI